MPGLRFGVFLLDSDRGALLAGGQAVRLTRKNFEVLQQLALAEGRLVSRDELVRVVWQATAVEEATVRQSVYTLRTALREIDPGREYVETGSNGGYRLALPVEHVDAGPVDAASPPSVAPQASTRRVIPWRAASMVLAALILFAGWAVLARWPDKPKVSAETLSDQGWQLLDKRDPHMFEGALALFDDAIARNPKLAAAHSGKAVLLAFQEKEEAAEAEARRVAEIQPWSRLPAAIRGFNRMMRHWDWAEAARLFAGELRCAEPVCLQWQALNLGLKGENLLAVRAAADAVQKAPTALAPRAQLAQLLYWDGQYDAAIQECETVLKAGGVGTHARYHLWKAQLAKGNQRAAGETLLLSIEPSWFTLHAGDEFIELQRNRDRLGTPQFFKRLLEIREPVKNWSYMSAEIAMAAGDRERALEELEQCLKIREFFLPFARREPIFAPLHGNPRYEAVMKAVGL